MSRNAKFDAYFDLLDGEEVKEIQVPAVSSARLCYNVTIYKNAPHRNKKKLNFRVETRKGEKGSEFWVVVVGKNYEPLGQAKKEEIKIVKIGEYTGKPHNHEIGVSRSGALWMRYKPEEKWQRMHIKKLFD